VSGDQTVTIAPVSRVVCTGWNRVRVDRGADQVSHWRHEHAPGCTGIREVSKGLDCRVSHGMSPECEARWRTANGLRNK
jgi:hypothetical protein